MKTPLQKILTSVFSSKNKAEFKNSAEYYKEIIKYNINILIPSELLKPNRLTFYDCFVTDNSIVVVYQFMDDSQTPRKCNIEMNYSNIEFWCYHARVDLLIPWGAEYFEDEFKDNSFWRTIKSHLEN